MGLKINACISCWGQFWAKDTKRPKKKKKKTHPTATSELLGAETGCWEQKQGIVHSPCTHHQLRSGQNT